MNNKEEVALRENIRHMIRYVKQKKQNEEYVLRSLIREMIDIEFKNLTESQTPDVNPTPNKSTEIMFWKNSLRRLYQF